MIHYEALINSRVYQTTPASNDSENRAILWRRTRKQGSKQVNQSLQVEELDQVDLELY